MAKVSVLVVEDSPFMATVVARMLAPHPDIDVIGAAGSAAQARAVAAGGKAFDVATVDLDLPDGNGVPLVGELARAGKGVVVVSGSVELYEDARSCGAAACFDKAGLMIRSQQFIEKVCKAAKAQRVAFGRSARCKQVIAKAMARRNAMLESYAS